MFYDRFIDLCEEKGVKPSRVALDCGFNKGSVSVWKSKWESGADIKPSSEILGKLSEYFDVTVDYLLGKSAQKNPQRAAVTDDDIKFALFGGADNVTDEMLEDVRSYAFFIKERNKNKKD